MLISDTLRKMQQQKCNNSQLKVNHLLLIEHGFSYLAFNFSGNCIQYKIQRFYKILRLSEYVRAERDSNLQYTVRETNEYTLKTGFDI